MAHMNNPEYFIRLLKGAPISVFYALNMARARGPVSAEWLQRVTGYSDKPVSQALALLAEYGLAQRGEGHLWVAASGAEALLAGSPAEPAQPKTDEALPQAVPAASSAEAEVGNIPTALPPSRSSSIQNLDSSSELDARLRDLDSSSHLDASFEDLDSSAGEEAENFQATLVELDRAGIREPARSRLAKLKRVTPGLIRFHVAHAEKLGQAVYRLETPGWWDNGYRAADWEDIPGIPAAAEIYPAEDDEPLEPLTQEDADAWVSAVARLPMKCWSWVNAESLLRAAGGVFTARVGNHYALEWLDANATAAQLAAEIEDITGQKAQVQFVVR